MTSETCRSAMAHVVFKMTELLKQILQHAIAEETNESFFLTTGQHPINLDPDFPANQSRPFSKRCPRNAGAISLRVCKRWSEVGLRPLYYTVILSRRRGQVASLVNSLRHHRERSLGRYITVLILYNNVEFGETFEELFEYTKNLHTLSISVNFTGVQVRENFDCLIKILPCISPRALILRDVQFGNLCSWRPNSGPHITDFGFSPPDEKLT